MAIKTGHMNFKLWVDWLMVCSGRVIKFDNCAGLLTTRVEAQADNPDCLRPGDVTILYLISYIYRNL